MVLTWVGEETSRNVFIHVKAIQVFLSVVLFVMLYKVVLNFESVDEILKCDHSNESYWAVLSCGAVYCAVQGGSKFWVCHGWNPKEWPFRWKLLSSTLLGCCLLRCARWFLSFNYQWSIEWRPNKSYWSEHFVPVTAVQCCFSFHFS